MPTEERFVTFSLDEIYKALSIFLILKETSSLAPGELIALDLMEGDSRDNISMKIENASGEIVDLNFERKFFAEALVFYCQGSGIPLPKRGQKILNILKDKIIMKINMA